jgi:hypothetical protein
MSNALALVSVTTVIKSMLENAWTEIPWSEKLGALTVSARPPDRVASGAADPNQLNLFLYCVTPNASFRNTALPSHSNEGERMTNPPLALDLHYLLTAFGSDNFHAEILLGYAMQILHETPILSRQAIRAVLAKNGGQSTIPSDLQEILALSDLADQVEQIRITPQPLNIDEISKLWTALTAHYRLSASYLATAVLIESRRPIKPSLPVRERMVYAMPIQAPFIRAMEADSDPLGFIVSDSTLVIRGERLRGAINHILIDGNSYSPLEKDVRDTKILLAMPAGIQAGLHAVQVAHEVNLGLPATPHRGVESNVVPFLLHPKVAVPASAAGEVVIQFDPKVGKSQSVKLRLSEHPAPSNRPAKCFVLDPPQDNGITQEGETETGAITFGLDKVDKATYLARIQVDGAESELIIEQDKQSSNFNQYIGPSLTIA